jgi:hypothetical protein
MFSSDKVSPANLCSPYYEHLADADRVHVDRNLPAWPIVYRNAACQASLEITLGAEKSNRGCGAGEEQEEVP